MFNVVIEGADGVGKSTLISALSLECQNLFRDHLGVLKFKTLREPGGTRLGEYIREHVIFPADEVDYDKHYAKRLGYILSHADLAYELKKLKDDGYAILLDRFSPISNRVY